MFTHPQWEPAAKQIGPRSPAALIATSGIGPWVSRRQSRSVSVDRQGGQRCFHQQPKPPARPARESADRRLARSQPPIGIHWRLVPWCRPIAPPGPGQLCAQGAVNGLDRRAASFNLMRIGGRPAAGPQRSSLGEHRFCGAEAEVMPGGTAGLALQSRRAAKSGCLERLPTSLAGPVQATAGSVARGVPSRGSSACQAEGSWPCAVGNHRPSSLGQHPLQLLANGVSAEVTDDLFPKSGRFALAESRPPCSTSHTAGVRPKRSCRD